MSTNVAVLEARKTVTMLFAGGLAMLVVGLVVAAGAWPHTDIDVVSGTSETQGSLIVAIVAIAIAAVGQLLAAIAVVAWGVRFGMESVEPATSFSSSRAGKSGARRVWSEKEGRFVDESSAP